MTTAPHLLVSKILAKQGRVSSNETLELARNAQELRSLAHLLGEGGDDE